MAHRPEDLTSSVLRTDIVSARSCPVVAARLSHEGTENQTNTLGKLQQTHERGALTSADGLDPKLDRWMLLHDRRNDGTQ
jgi:hypothetical protein